MEKKTRVQLMGAAAVVVCTATSVWAQTITPLTTAIIPGDSGNVDTTTDSSAGLADGKGIENVVTVTGTYDGTDYVDTAFENVDVVAANPGIDITKSSSVKQSGGSERTVDAEVNDVITYTYVVKNTGKVTLTDVGFVDKHWNAVAKSKADGSFVDLYVQSCSVTTPETDKKSEIDNKTGEESSVITSFAPGEVVTCSATYTVTQDDIDELQ